MITTAKRGYVSCLFLLLACALPGMSLLGILPKKFDTFELNSLFS